jgi:uncharacterized protein (TIGR02246 family)
MRNRWYHSILALAAVTAAVGAVTVVGQDDAAAAYGVGPQDLAAIAEIRDTQAQAWYAEDGGAFAATFTSNADMVTFNGDHLQTRAGIATGMQYYFDNYIDHSAIRYLAEDVNVIGPDLVIVVRDTCLLVEPDDADCRDGSLSVNTNVMVKRRGTWLQQSFQNTRVVPIP